MVGIGDGLRLLNKYTTVNDIDKRIFPVWGRGKNSDTTEPRLNHDNAALIFGCSLQPFFILYIFFWQNWPHLSLSPARQDACLTLIYNTLVLVAGKICNDGMHMLQFKLERKSPNLFHMLKCLPIWWTFSLIPFFHEFSLYHKMKLLA